MTHVIYRGQGWLAAVIIFGFSLAGNLLFDTVYGNGYYDHHKWPFAFTLFLSGAVCLALGRSLRARSDRIVIDKETGKEFVLNRSQHTLFFVPVYLWGVILPLIALVIFVVELVQH